jgi:hypothetical protein
MKIANLVNVAIRAAAYTGHVYYVERFWKTFLDGSASFLIARPEKSVSFYLREAGD